MEGAKGGGDPKAFQAKGGAVMERTLSMSMDEGVMIVTIAAERIVATIEGAG